MNQKQGQRKTRELIKKGVIIPLTKCQICGKIAGTKTFSFETPVKIVPHHYKGYDFPNDVWFICRSCNRRLFHKHDNSLTLEDAVEYIFGEPLGMVEEYKEAYRQELVQQIQHTENRLDSLKKQLQLTEKSMKAIV